MESWLNFVNPNTDHEGQLIIECQIGRENHRCVFRQNDPQSHYPLDLFEAFLTAVAGKSY